MTQQDKRPSFASHDEAERWMVERVDDGCIDNHRFAYLDDDQSMRLYETRREDGCCGSFDADVIVDGRAARIGCNYGH